MYKSELDPGFQSLSVKKKKIGIVEEIGIADDIGRNFEYFIGWLVVLQLHGRVTVFSGDAEVFRGWSDLIQVMDVEGFQNYDLNFSIYKFPW